MTRLVVIRESRALVYVLVFALVMTVIVNLAILYQASVVLEYIMVKLFLGVFDTLVFLGVIWMLYRYRCRTRSIEELSSRVLVGDREVKLQSIVGVEKGFVETTGYWVSTGKSRSYHYKTWFTSSTPVQPIDTVDLEAFDNKYTVLIDRDGTGVLYAPCYRIVDKRFKDVLLIVLKPCNLKLLSHSLSISVVSERDVAEASIELEDGVLRGSVKRVISGRARSVRLELCGRLEFRKRKYSIRKVIARVEHGSTFFEEPLCPKEPLVVIVHRGSLTPLRILKALNKKVAILGLAYGEYRLRLVLDIPLGRDIYKEIPLQFTRT